MRGIYFDENVLVKPVAANTPIKKVRNPAINTPNLTAHLLFPNLVIIIMPPDQ